MRNIWREGWKLDKKEAEASMIGYSQVAYHTGFCQLITYCRLRDRFIDFYAISIGIFGFFSKANLNERSV